MSDSVAPVSPYPTDALSIESLLGLIDSLSKLPKALIDCPVSPYMIVNRLTEIVGIFGAKLKSQALKLGFYLFRYLEISGNSPIVGHELIGRREQVLTR